MPKRDDPITERMTAVRKRTGLSQAALAKKLGISDRSYKNYELGIRDLPTSVARKLAGEWGINLRWLILGEGFIDDLACGDAVMSVVTDTRNFLIDNKVNLEPEKEAKVVRYLFQQIEEHGPMSEQAKQSFFKTIL